MQTCMNCIAKIKGTVKDLWNIILSVKKFSVSTQETYAKRVFRCQNFWQMLINYTLRKAKKKIQGVSAIFKILCHTFYKL